jgi:hypothetical protein
LASGDVVLGPKFGTFTIGDTTTSTNHRRMRNNHCLNLQTQDGHSQLHQHAEDYSDEDWYYFFDKYAKNYTLFYMDGCDGGDRIYLNDTVISAIRLSQGFGSTVGSGAAVPATFPGFGLSITQTPKWSQGPNGLGKAGIWSMAGTFSTVGVVRSATIPGLRQLLEA